MPEIVTYRSLPDDDVLQAAADVYLDAFSRPPYGETRDDQAAFLDRVRRYAAREGFRLVAAVDGSRLVGIGLAVVAHPGDWYRDQLASGMTPAEVDRWLAQDCLEVVHLAVRPIAEGQGLGGRLLAALVADPGAPTGVLTVSPLADRARRLYRRHGWSLVREDVRVGDAEPVELMACEL